MKRGSPAFRALAPLVVGDQVPSSLYVLDHRDGTHPRWVVHHREGGAAPGVIRLVLVDLDNTGSELFPVVAVNVITWPAKTLRSPAYPLGAQPAGVLCDLDQQGRAVERPERAA